MAKKIDVEVHLGDTNTVFCPACGVQATPTEEIQDPEICEHIIAVYLDIISEFIYVKPEYQDLVNTIQEDEEVEYPLETFMEKTGSPSVMFLAVTQSGVTSHGPHADTITVGVDYAPDSGN